MAVFQVEGKTADRSLQKRTIARLRWMLKPEELPKLTEAFYGTKRLIAIRKLFLTLFPTRITGTIRTTVFFAFFFATFLYIAYLDYVQYINSEAVEFLSCGDKKWNTDNCGLNGVNCQPFESDEWHRARCPKRCYREGIGIIGNSPYPGTNRICASAMHQGLIDYRQGGCFRYRFSGEQTNFTSGGKRNNIESLNGSWFPKSFELSSLEREVAGETCNSIGAWIGVYPLVILLLFVVFFAFEENHLKSFNFLFIVVCGWLSLATRGFSDEYWEFLAGFSDNLNGFVERDDEKSFFFRLNRFTVPVLFTLLPICYLLYLYAGRPTTFPDPVSFPVDCFLFYVLPFWAGVQLNFYAALGLNTILNDDFELKPSIIVAIILFVPLSTFQCLAYYRSGDLKLGIIKFLLLSLVIVVIGVSCSAFVSIHIHHWFVGLWGFIYFQGQPNTRYSIILQATMVSVMFRHKGTFLNVFQIL
uniref:LCCL domain-containing protein n=1 Tax=Aplanochytrium stocchinoi TaxID=215587 RepID=A0A7S3LS80_9STRA